MPTKLDTLKITKLIKKKKKMTDLIKFIKELIAVEDLKTFYLSFELTLFTYNVIINGYKKISGIDIKVELLYILKQVFEKTEYFTEEEKNIIYKDIDYIEKYKLYTYISDIYVFLYNCFFFFTKQ
jgi:hypothetical protein